MRPSSAKPKDPKTINRNRKLRKSVDLAWGARRAQTPAPHSPTNAIATRASGL